MVKKSEQALQYLKSLPPGESISVRQMAHHLDISEGTAYRAIKEGERQGIVATIPRVGTVRISTATKEDGTLTFSDIIPMIDGIVYSGDVGLMEPLEQFMIGAMDERVIGQYLRPNALLIVGNREKIQEQALKNGMAILITGGFRPTAAIRRLSQEMKRPVIGCDYDSFTAATMINRALGEQHIKKDIIRIHDVKLPFSKMTYLHHDDTVGMYFKSIQSLSYDTIPVIDKQQRLVGIMTHHEAQGKDLNLPLEKVMKRHVASVNNDTNVASVAHLMIWDNYHYLPVVKENGILDGIVSRKDIMTAMEEGPLFSSNMRTFSEEVGDTLTETVEMVTEQQQQTVYSVKVTPQMIHRDGTLSFGVMSELLISVTRRYLDKHHRNYRLTIEQLTIDFIELAQLDSHLSFYPHLFDERRLMAKVDIDIYNDKHHLIAKGKIICHLLSEQTN